MDHPKCRTCGERHRMGPCPQINSTAREAGREITRPRALRLQQGAATPGQASTAPKRARQSPESGNVAKPQQQPIAGTPAAPAPSKPKRKRAPVGSFDRKAYQREYMQKRRAAARKEAGA